MPIKSFKTELDPNNVQTTKLAQHAGAARFTYNWAITVLQDDFNKKREEEKSHIEQRKSLGYKDYTDKELKEYRKELNKKYLQPSAITLHKLLNTKKETEFPWMYDVSKWSPQNALRNLEIAYKNFYSSKSSKRKIGLPKKKKKDNHESFTVDCPVIVMYDSIKLPKIGIIRLKESGYIPKGQPKSATVTKRANRWFVSVYYDIEIKKVETIDKTIGVDLGIKSLISCSDGTVIENSKKLKKLEKSLKRQQKKLAKQNKGSNSRKNTKLKIQKIHYKISCSRNDILHKATSLLTKTKLEKYIIMEDLCVSGMMKNRNLAKAITNVGMGEFERQMLYKSNWYGKELGFVDRFYPSSKKCSRCGHIKYNLKLSDRTYVCENCGLVIDRDFNASLNIENCEDVKYISGVIKNTVRYTVIEAGGDESFINLSKDELRCLSMKPELNIKFT